MILTVILLYCICLLPFKTLQLLLNFKLISYCSELELSLLLSVYLTFHWMAMAHSCVNPIIYSYMSRSFRVSLASFLSSSRDKNCNDFFPFSFWLLLITLLTFVFQKDLAKVIARFFHPRRRAEGGTANGRWS